MAHRLARRLAAALVLASLPCGAAPRLLPAPCPDDVDATAVTCGTFRVPEDYAARDGRHIDLYVVVVPAAQPHADAVPLVQLAGGPGLPIADTAVWLLEEGSVSYAYRRDRAVILVDQRGTGQSNALHCPALEARHPLQPFYPPDDVIACRDRLSQKNDLTQFTTANSALDLDRVRAALGYERIDLWAISYGTILAQEFMRRYADRVRSAVLVGTAPLDNRFPLHHAAHAQQALDALFDECAADAACHDAYAVLRGDWQTLLARLEGTAPAAGTEQAADARVWARDVPRGPFGEAFRQLLGSAASLRRVPSIVHEAAAGNLPSLLDALGGSGDAIFASGLYLSTTCAEGTARISPGAIGPAVARTFLGDYRVRQQRAACDAWPRAAIPDSFFEPVRADLPVLFLVGDLDYITPPAWSEQVARGFRNSRVVRMPHGGHLYWDWGDGNAGGDCFDELALAFYAAGDAEHLDTRCVDRVTPPPFVVD